MIREIVFFVEEASARAMLQGLLPKLVPEEIELQFRVFEGKTDLMRRLVPQMRAYRKPGCKFVVLRDQDAAPCRNIKKELLDLCNSAGKGDTLVRIACHELESWYLADLSAVEKGLDVPGISKHQQKAKFRLPDRLTTPSRELLRLTGNRYKKIDGSRRIAPHMDVENKRSRSFGNFVIGIRKIAEEADAK